MKPMPLVRFLIQARPAYLFGDTSPQRRVGRAAEKNHPSIRSAIGQTSWRRLPEAVRLRFADEVVEAEYVGTFETVRATLAGKILALICRLIGTPVAPYTGQNVPARVRVHKNAAGGMVWDRAYEFSGNRRCVVSSTKQLDARGRFVEALPLGLRMPLDVFERDGVLNFLSKRYEFHWLGLRLRVPDIFPPGQTHVEHIDEGSGWFRFTMTVRHSWFGEVYFQTGRFREA